MKSLWCVVVGLSCATTASAADDWFPFNPQPDVSPQSVISLRSLNESVAGEQGQIIVKDGQFVHEKTGRPVRFWAVNSSPDTLTGDTLKQSARILAAYGVNLVRVHGPLFDKDGEVDPARVRRAQEIVAALKAEGIYTHFSIYFPLWFTPRADLPWLKGYDGKQHPFAALEFNPQFQEKYRGWFKALLTTMNDAGRTLADDPAVFGIELQNEDSFFFWTFDARNIPDAQLRILESQFGAWLAKKYGSIDAALKKWNGLKTPRDAAAEGRVGFRPLWNLSHEKTPRDQDTAQFLLQVQTGFYRDTAGYLKDLGFKGLVHCSNWATADAEVLGPLEKLSYTAGDFIDRHGYFECHHQGDNAAWSIRAGHTYSDRSALRFDPAEPGKPKEFVHPVMDPHYDSRPSMISETTFTRPNRYRSEAPLYFAAYGALQDSNCIVHFAFDGPKWEVKPRFWMQQWTLTTPAMIGQFPAAALIYRKGLVSTGAVVADVTLNRDDLVRLKGTPLPQDAAFDELRLKDVPQGTDVKPGQRLDPLLHYTGKTVVRFSDKPGKVTASNAKPLIDRQAQTVVSTTKELKLDYRSGVLVMNAPQAQGGSGNLRAAGSLELEALKITSDLDLAHVLAVSLDDRPLKTSKKILLQVMSEEQNTGFTTEPVDKFTKRITNLGRYPWQVKTLSGQVQFLRGDAKQLKVTPLDFNGRKQAPFGTAESIRLQPQTLYYLIEQ